MESGDQALPEQPEISSKTLIADRRRELLQNKAKLSVILFIEQDKNPNALKKFYMDHRNELIEEDPDQSDKQGAEKYRADGLRAEKAEKLYLEHKNEAEGLIKEAFSQEALDREYALRKTELANLDEEARFAEMDKLESELARERRHRALSGLIGETRTRIDKLEEILVDEKK